MAVAGVITAACAAPPANTVPRPNMAAQIIERESLIFL